MSTFTIKEGDYHRQIRIDLRGLSTTDATGVVFRMVDASGAVIVNDAAGTIVDANTVSYQFEAPQLATAGTYQLEATLDYPDGEETAPTGGYVTVVVVPRLG